MVNTINPQRSGSKIVLAVIVLILVIGAALYFMNGRDHRTTGERVGDAVDSVNHGEGLGEAAEDLGDKTPAEKATDAVDDAMRKD